MTKKDYELIAAALAYTRETARKDLHPQALAMWDRTARDLADALATTNARFDRARFLAACGVAS